MRGLTTHVTGRIHGLGLILTSDIAGKILVSLIWSLEPVPVSKNFTSMSPGLAEFI